MLFEQTRMKRPRQQWYSYHLLCNPVFITSTHLYLQRVQGQAVYAAEADRLRMWAEGEGKRQSPLAAAMDLAPSSAWISLFSSSVICAYIMLSNLGEAGPPGGGL